MPERGTAWTLARRRSGGGRSRVGAPLETARAESGGVWDRWPTCGPGSDLVRHDAGMCPMRGKIPWSGVPTTGFSPCHDPSAPPRGYDVPRSWGRPEHRGYVVRGLQRIVVSGIEGWSIRPLRARPPLHGSIEPEAGSGRGRYEIVRDRVSYRPGDVAGPVPVLDVDRLFPCPARQPP